MLNFKQRKFSVKLVILPDENPVKNILPIIFKNRDELTQPIKQPIDNTD